MKIAVLKGDGIGPEIVEAAQFVLQKADEKYKLGLTYHEALFGGAAYDVYGNPYPQETQEIVAGCDAILLGSVGAPKYDKVEPSSLRPESGLLAIRKSLGLYCNIRPIKYYDFLADRVVWKKGLLDGLDIVICRELTGGAYFGARG
ncbi:MAG: 3-isopropylmalate dehydrogenase, partial [Peptococcaceae bacterium]|nr:3-isopropylmalate dehydrogenase [Peptococcaceae bacterium]